MLKRFIALLFVVLLGACSTTRDGIRVGVGGTPTQSDVDKIKQQVEKNAQSTAAKEAANALAAPTAKRAGVALIGTVGPLREVEAAKRKTYYKGYLAEAEKWHPGKPAQLSEQQYADTIGGWTTIETFSIPGIMTYRLPALVPVGALKKVDFASTFGSFMVGTTGDLVVAINNADGFMVLDKVLCKDSSSDYRACASSYESGRFDLTSGMELGRDLKPKEGGSRIDTSTFKVIKDAAH